MQYEIRQIIEITNGVSKIISTKMTKLDSVDADLFNIAQGIIEDKTRSIIPLTKVRRVGYIGYKVRSKVREKYSIVILPNKEGIWLGAINLHLGAYSTLFPYMKQTFIENRDFLEKIIDQITKDPKGLIHSKK